MPLKNKVFPLPEVSSFISRDKGPSEVAFPKRCLGLSGFLREVTEERQRHSWALPVGTGRAATRGHGCESKGQFGVAFFQAKVPSQQTRLGSFKVSLETQLGP